MYDYFNIRNLYCYAIVLDRMFVVYNTIQIIMFYIIGQCIDKHYVSYCRQRLAMKLI